MKKAIIVLLSFALVFLLMKRQVKIPSTFYKYRRTRKPPTTTVAPLTINQQVCSALAGTYATVPNVSWGNIESQPFYIKKYYKNKWGELDCNKNYNSEIATDSVKLTNMKESLCSSNLVSEQIKGLLKCTLAYNKANKRAIVRTLNIADIPASAILNPDTGNTTEPSTDYSNFVKGSDGKITLNYADAFIQQYFPQNDLKNGNITIYGDRIMI